MKKSDRRANGAIISPTSPSRSSVTAESGLIVFSSPTHILQINSHAQSLMALFGESRNAWTLPAYEAMPSILTEFCRDVLEQFRDGNGAHDWAHFEMRRVCHMVNPPLLIRGFGVPDSASQRTRVVLTLHRLGPSDHHSPDEESLETIFSGRHFHLT